MCYARLSILDANINTAMDTSFCTNHYNVIIMLHNLWSLVVWIFDVCDIPCDLVIVYYTCTFCDKGHASVKGVK